MAVACDQETAIPSCNTLRSILDPAEGAVVRYLLCPEVDSSTVSEVEFCSGPLAWVGEESEDADLFFFCDDLGQDALNSVPEDVCPDIEVPDNEEDPLGEVTDTRVFICSDDFVRDRH